MTESTSATKSLRAQLKKFLVGFMLIATIAAFLVARIVETTEVLLAKQLPTHWETLIHQLNSLSTTFLLCEILIYLVLERSELLPPLRTTQEIVTYIAQRMKGFVSESDTLEKVLDRTNAWLLGEIKKPNSVDVYKTPEEVYSAIPKVVDRLNSAVECEKRMMHGMLHLSPATQQTKTAEPRLAGLQEYYSAFDATMTKCIQSTGHNRWFVQQLYNITTTERLDVVVERMKLGTEGFEVRAIAVPDIPPAFSPLLMGEEDATLAILESSNNRVGSAIHLRGTDAVKFVERYFDLLWDYKYIFRLRSEQGIDWDEVNALKKKIESLPARTRR